MAAGEVERYDVEDRVARGVDAVAEGDPDLSGEIGTIRHLVGEEWRFPGAEAPSAANNSAASRGGEDR